VRPYVRATERHLPYGITVLSATQQVNTPTSTLAGQLISRFEGRGLGLDVSVARPSQVGLVLDKMFNVSVSQLCSSGFLGRLMPKSMKIYLNLPKICPKNTASRLFPDTV